MSGSPTSSRRSRCGRSPGPDRGPREPKGRSAAWTEERGAKRRATREGGASRRPGGERGNTVYVGALTLDVLLGDVRSLKQKRSAVRPLVAEVNRRFPGASVAETGHLDLHRRAGNGGAAGGPAAARPRPGLRARRGLLPGRAHLPPPSGPPRLSSPGGGGG